MGIENPPLLSRPIPPVFVQGGACMTIHERSTIDASGPTTFAQLLKRHRQHAALSQEELAERVRLTAQTISSLERGVRQTPHWTTVRLLCEALGLKGEHK